MITTRNASWGFFGTLRSNGATDAEAIYDDAARAMMAKLGLTPDQARAVLDARIGRHMADQRRDDESGKELVERLLANRGWARDIRAAIRREVTLAVQHEEVPVLRFALDHALSSISEAHAEDRAQLRALIERLEAAGRVRS
jgi:hypothetical protein